MTDAPSTPSSGSTPGSGSTADGMGEFVARHIGPDDAAVAHMLEAIGHDSLDSLMSAAVPDGIRSAAGLDLPDALDEEATARALRTLASQNRPAEAMIGLGYHATITPPVIRRNVLEDPSWYTAYTPYQPEISQGRLEALLNFQTVVADLTGLPTANASLLDEGTAAAEAMTLVRRAQRNATGPFVVDADALPQTIDVVRTRAEGMGIEVVVADLGDGLPDGDLCGADVGGRLVAADVLLAGLERQPVGRAPLGVDRHTDQPAGQVALEALGDGHEPGVRAAVEQRNAEAL